MKTKLFFHALFIAITSSIGLIAMESDAPPSFGPHAPLPETIEAFRNAAKHRITENYFWNNHIHFLDLAADFEKKTNNRLKQLEDSTGSLEARLQTLENSKQQFSGDAESQRKLHNSERYDAYQSLACGIIGGLITYRLMVHERSIWIGGFIGYWSLTNLLHAHQKISNPVHPKP